MAFVFCYSPSKETAINRISGPVAYLPYFVFSPIREVEPKKVNECTRGLMTAVANGRRMDCGVGSGVTTNANFPSDLISGCCHWDAASFYTNTMRSLFRSIGFCWCTMGLKVGGCLYFIYFFLHLPINLPTELFNDRKFLFKNSDTLINFIILYLLETQYVYILIWMNWKKN